ncbi:hypothetical protein JCM24511_07314 [Saitozyma sp. JCM 24511]|nr:hypothetical protein JCM24511_07314 [Saitozyma sp. JCM 24511]
MSVAQGPREGMTDWWVIDKEEGDEEQQDEVYYEEGRGTAWFEELLANIRQDEYTCDDGREAECTESSVSKAVYDLDYRSEGMVAYCIPVSLSLVGNPHAQISQVERPTNISADANSTEA